MAEMQMQAKLLSSRILSAHNGLTHGFFGRQGGVSHGCYASLNCGLGSGDVREDIDENRRRVAARLNLPLTALATPSQEHGNTVLTLREPITAKVPPAGDGLVTQTPGIALGIGTADCVPVLFVDRQARVIGAAHAGWSGALRGIIAATVEAMLALGAVHTRIEACIGPAIQQQSYEFGAELRATFIADHADNQRFFVPAKASEKFLFDLPGYVAMRLGEAGLTGVEQLTADTAADAENFFSYRRSRHLGEPDYGRQLSVIALQ